MRVISSVFLGLSFLISSPQYVSAQDEQQPPAAHCNTVGAALIGGVLGALAGRAIGGRHSGGVLAGAAAGAVIGGLACASVNAHTVRRASNEQVRGQLGAAAPSGAEFRVVDFQSEMGAAQYTRGSEVVIRSAGTVALGPMAQGNLLSERIEITSPTGERKVFDRPIDGAGGAFTQITTFTPPTQVPTGAYAVNAILLVNGVAQRSDQLTFELV